MFVYFRVKKPVDEGYDKRQDDSDVSIDPYVVGLIVVIHPIYTLDHLTAQFKRKYFDVIMTNTILIYRTRSQQIPDAATTLDVIFIDSSTNNNC